jgi:hypothetical protein
MNTDCPSMLICRELSRRLQLGQPVYLEATVVNGHIAFQRDRLADECQVQECANLLGEAGLRWRVKLKGRAERKQRTLPLSSHQQSG